MLLRALSNGIKIYAYEIDRPDRPSRYQQLTILSSKYMQKSGKVNEFVNFFLKPLFFSDKNHTRKPFFVFIIYFFYN